MTTRNPKLAFFTAPLLVLSALLAGGCGGGSSSSGSAATTRATGSTQAQRQAPSGAVSPASPATTQTSSTPTATAPGGGQSAIAAANRVCRRRNRELTALNEPSAKNLHALAATARRQAAIEQRALGELERLTPPAGVAAQYHQIVNANQATLLAVVKAGEAAEAGNAAEAQTAKAREKPEQLNLLYTAVRAGLRECAGVPTGRPLKGLPIP